jgi:hypothetical protein
MFKLKQNIKSLSISQKNMIYTPFQIPPPISKESSSYLVLIATHCSSQSKNSIRIIMINEIQKRNREVVVESLLPVIMMKMKMKMKRFKVIHSFVQLESFIKKKKKEKKKVDFFGLTFHRKLWLLALFTNSIHRGFVVSWYFIKVLRLKLCVIVFI